MMIKSFKNEEDEMEEESETTLSITSCGSIELKK
jgi:hypothetical protein